MPTALKVHSGAMRHATYVGRHIMENSVATLGILGTTLFIFLCMVAEVV